MSNGGYQNGRLPASALAPIYRGQLKKEAAAGWNAMNVEARSKGLELYPTGSASSYRTYDQQVQLYNAYLNGTGNLAAKPGTSNHGWGDAVDVPYQSMRQMIDNIGARYGWSKTWSDAPSEWWHIVYQSGHYSGPDPGPGKPTPEPITDEDTITTVVKRSGALEVFVVKADTGRVFHRWQPQPNAGQWSDWQAMGTPGG